MDSVSLIVGALAAGAAKGVGDSAASAVGDVYRRLKELIGAQIAGHPKGEQALVDYEDDPEIYKALLVKVLQETNAADDASAVELAQQLLGLIDSAGTKAGKYVVTVTGSQGVQIGDAHIQNNTFG